MSDTVIRVENLGKRYIIGHQQQEKYTALRDVLANKVKGITNIFNRKSKGQNPKSEEFWALKDVSFEVKRGDRIGIIGRNGAGKSTLLKILSRITEPTEGRISIKGRVASLLEVGTGFHPELTGRENIYLNGAILGMSKVEIRRKFDEIVAFAEVEKFLDTPVKRYSSGMYVRLAFAVAAHLEPEVLVVDEVLAVGDSAFQEKCLGKMEDVTAEGRTVIFVSHNMSSVIRLCSKAILLKNGFIQSMGNTENLIDLYFKSDHKTTACKRWNYSQSPRSEIARLLEIKAHDETGKVSESFNITKPIGIAITYEVSRSDRVFTQSINLFNSSGNQILSSHDVVSDFSKKARESGIYSSTMWIPKNFLSEGLIIVSVALLEQEPFVIYFHETDAISFNVFDPMDGSSARGKCLMPFPGVVRPILDWETRKILDPTAVLSRSSY